MSVEIIPAILPKDFAELCEQVDLVKGLVKTVQIDVCDGQFTPQPSWPYRKPDDSFDKIIHEEEGMPAWKELDYEIDLMINYKSPEQIQNWIMAGATRLVIHAESKGDLDEAFRVAGIQETGIALDIETPLDVIGSPRCQNPDMCIKFVQLMGIDQIGFQGQAFDDKVIARVKEVKVMYPHLLVSIDGGVTLENAPKLIAVGADRLVIGSAIFQSDNPIDAVMKFKELGK